MWAPRPLVWRWVATTAHCLLQVTPCLPRVASTATAALAIEVKAEQQKRTLVPPQACQEFSHQQEIAASEHGTVKNRSTRAASVPPPSSPSPSSLDSSWSASDCMDVWASWTATLPASLQPSYANRELLKERAADMRARGSPCLVEAIVKADGAGSMTMRHLAAKIFAEEVGCDWLTPSQWGMPAAGDGSGASVYCHSAATYEEQRRGFGNATKDEAESMVHRCSVVNWPEYFNLNASSVEPPANCAFRVVEADTSSNHDLEMALKEIDANGLDNLEWDRLKIVLRQPHASSNFLVSLGSWDGWKREVVRKVLRQFRENFHLSPRPWHNDEPECGYEESELNFALHVRMGDRRELEGVTLEYFSLLEGFMATVTQAVVKREQAAPMFHVFSEALYPCPSTENATFTEFPFWPVERDQVSVCLRNAAEQDVLASRTGTFRVEGRPILLHLGRNAAEALSCMVHADGLLMGCSTFGQLAGVLNGDGISFFSTECGGHGAPLQSKMIPPLAVAERGRTWVPIAGSWRDPVLRAKHIFSTALDELLKRKQRSTRGESRA